MTTPYPTRTQWRNARYAAACKALAAADRFFVLAPHETPADVRAPYSLAAWLALDSYARSNHVRDRAYAAFDAENPKPAPALPRQAAPAPSHGGRREPTHPRQLAAVRVLVQDPEAEARVRFASKLYRAEAAAEAREEAIVKTAPEPTPAPTPTTPAEPAFRSRAVVACARDCGRYLPTSSSYKPVRAVCRKRCID